MRFFPFCKYLPAFLCILLLSIPLPGDAQMPAEGTSSYVVKRDGSPIGTLKISFARDGKRLVAKSEYSIKVKLLAIVLYRYDKRMTETYEDGRLVAYETDIDDNGSKSQVRVTRDGDTLTIVHPKGKLTAPVGLYPTTYWPAATPGILYRFKSVLYGINLKHQLILYIYTKA